MSDFEREDMELAAMLGDKFIDETKPMTEMPKMEQKIEPPKPKKAVQKAEEEQRNPVKQRTWMDDLKDCMKSSLIFGGLNILIWYWETAGLMAESIARPSSWVCVALFGIGIGKVLRDK